MKQSKMLIHTLRNAPRDAEVISQQLMIRAGMIQKLATGIYSYLPLGFRVINKFEAIIREELAKDGCQELLLPMVQSSEIWQESGRWYHYGKELLRFKDRKNAEFCLGPTHEEVITDIVRRNVDSYKQLPMNLFQIQTKFRDEIRPRFGLMRSREFIMKDGYSFDINDAASDESYWTMFNAYNRIFSRLGINFRYVEADGGAIGGSFTHEFHVLAGSGEDAILSCDSCNYTSNAEKAESFSNSNNKINKITDIKYSYFYTPEIFNIESQALAFKDEVHDGLPLHQTSKVYWFNATLVNNVDKNSIMRKSVVAVILRGDHEINLVKVKNYIGASEIEIMPNIESFSGATSGFVGPIPKKGTPHWHLQEEAPDSIIYLADIAICGASGLTCGANINGYHHFGFYPMRDIPNIKFADLRVAKEGDICARCNKGHYNSFRGIEVGQIFKLGTKYSKEMNCTYLDENGREMYMVMGCYGIGISRTIAAVVEQNYDNDGIIWPWSIAPYHVHIVNIDPSNIEVLSVANRIEMELENSGFEVIHDDCLGLSPGVKFKNADLLGIPLRVTVGFRDLKSGLIELRDRRNKKSIKIKPENIVFEINAARDRIVLGF